MHTLDFLSLVLPGELKVELNVSFPRASALNHSGLCNKATVSVPDPDKINGFMNIRVADIQACYELWKSRGAEFITEPIPKYGEIRCYIRDPDGYIIEVGQSTELKYG